MRRTPKPFAFERVKRRPPSRLVANPRIEIAGPRRITVSIGGGAVNISQSAGEPLARADLPKWMRR